MSSTQTIIFSVFFLLFALCLARSEMESVGEPVEYSDNQVFDNARLPMYLSGANGYQKRWANQVRFGKRGSWASSVRFG
ncbi:unnamed protein product [Auanema sp. JU1783]|nr:unnamed protein product [Auanema sp. JU1783]